MNTLIIGESSLRNELKLALPNSFQVAENESTLGLEKQDLLDFDIIFDLEPKGNSSFILNLPIDKNLVLICNGLYQSLADRFAFVEHSKSWTILGISALPTFINRQVKELSVYKGSENSHDFTSQLSAFNWEYKVVADRVGMASARVIAMIINEACFTLQEGTAQVEAIDQSMKLGTAYPLGPFEWADKIGIGAVYQLLDSLYTDTQDGRYKICPLLKSKAFLKETFY